MGELPEDFRIPFDRQVVVKIHQSEISASDLQSLLVLIRNAAQEVLIESQVLEPTEREMSGHFLRYPRTDLTVGLKDGSIELVIFSVLFTAGTSAVLYPPARVTKRFLDPYLDRLGDNLRQKFERWTAARRRRNRPAPEVEVEFREIEG